MAATPAPPKKHSETRGGLNARSAAVGAGLGLALVASMWWLPTTASKGKDKSLEPSNMPERTERAAQHKASKLQGAIALNRGRPVQLGPAPDSVASNGVTSDAVAPEQKGALAADPEIARFDENVSLFNQRLALFDKELEEEQQNQTLSAAIQDFLGDYVKRLGDPGAEVSTTCTASVCEVQLTAPGDVLPIVGKTVPILNRFGTYATGAPRPEAVTEDASGYRLLLDAEEMKALARLQPR